MMRHTKCDKSVTLCTLMQHLQILSWRRQQRQGMQSPKLPVTFFNWDVVQQCRYNVRQTLYAWNSLQRICCGWGCSVYNCLLVFIYTYTRTGVIYVRSDRRHIFKPKIGLPQDKNSCFVASSLIALSSMTVLWDQLKFAAKDYEALLG